MSNRGGSLLRKTHWRSPTSTF